MLPTPRRWGRGLGNIMKKLTIEERVHMLWVIACLLRLAGVPITPAIRRALIIRAVELMGTIRNRKSFAVVVPILKKLEAIEADRKS